MAITFDELKMMSAGMRIGVVVLNYKDFLDAIALIPTSWVFTHRENPGAAYAPHGIERYQYFVLGGVEFRPGRPMIDYKKLYCQSPPETYMTVADGWDGIK